MKNKKGFSISRVFLAIAHNYWLCDTHIKQYRIYTINCIDKRINYEKINLFGKKQSRGTFDDFFDINKYETIEQAYNANDYVECDFVRDENGIIFIEARNVKNPELKKYHKLNYQRPFAGLDVSDDNEGVQLAISLF